MNLGHVKLLIYDSKFMLVSFVFRLEGTIFCIFTNWAKLKVLFDITVYLQNYYVMSIMIWLVTMSYYYPIAPSLEDQPNAQLSTKFFIV